MREHLTPIQALAWKSSLMPPSHCLAWQCTTVWPPSSCSRRPWLNSRTTPRDWRSENMLFLLFFFFFVCVFCTICSSHNSMVDYFLWYNRFLVQPCDPQNLAEACETNRQGIETANGRLEECLVGVEEVNVNVGRNAWGGGGETKEISIITIWNSKQKSKKLTKARWQKHKNKWG